jgi:hypothetical protein
VTQTLQLKTKRCRHFACIFFCSNFHFQQEMTAGLRLLAFVFFQQRKQHVIIDHAVVFDCPTQISFLHKAQLA